MKTRAQKLTTALGRCVVREPMYASVLLGVEVYDVPDHPQIKTAATDGKQIIFNGGYLAKLTLDETMGVLIHEAEHIMRLHPWRRQGRDLAVWNFACDYVINAGLILAKYILPKGVLHEPLYAGMAEEQIYAKLAASQPPSNPGGQGKPGQQGQQGNAPGQPGQGQPTPGQGQQGQPGQGQPQSGGQPGNQPGQGQPDAGQDTGNGIGDVIDCPGTDAEVHEQLAKTKVQVIRAAAMAKSQGTLPAGLASVVEEIKNPRVPWTELFRDYMTSFSKDDYSWLRPNRRYLPSGFYMPSLHSNCMGTLCIAFDTSGSVGGDEFAQFVAELRRIMDTVKPSKLIFIQADSAVQDYRVIEAGEQLPEQVELCGGGGTDFRPVFERIEAEQEQPELLVYLTDGYGTFPKAAPAYPVLWAITTEKETPWGDRIEIETN